MRIPYIPTPPPVASPEEESIIAAIAARRHPRPLQPLDLALLHPLPIANGWNTFVGVVREQTSLPDDLRELAICRIAVVNRAWYEWMHHAPLAIRAGVSSEAMEKLKGGTSLLKSEQSDVFTARQWAVSVMADEMTRNVQVEDDTFALLKSLFTDKEVVEIVATVSASNTVDCNGFHVS